MSLLADVDFWGMLPIRTVLGVAISFKDMSALYALSRIREASTQSTDVREIQRLDRIHSNLSEDGLLAYLNSSNRRVRARALGALRHLRLSEKGVQALMNEVKRGEYTTAELAVEILSEQRVQEAVPLLRQGLSSHDLHFQGACMIGLVLLRDRGSWPRIRMKFRASLHPRIAISGAQALELMGDTKNIEFILKKAETATLPEPVNEEVLLNAAALAGCEETFYRFVKQYNLDPGEALLDLFDTFEISIRNTLMQEIRTFLDTRAVSPTLLGILEQQVKTA